MRRGLRRRPSVVFWAALALSAGIAILATETAAFQENEGKTIITAEDIDDMKAVRIADVLNQVPGLKAGDASVSIHGNYKVKVFLDGRPINDPTSAHGGVKWDIVPLESIQQIEILKGQGGLEYGDDASGGVILVATKKMSRFSGNVKTYAGNHRTGSIGGNLRFTRELMGGALSASFEDTEGYKTNNDKEQYRGGGKIEYFPGETFDMTFSADYSRVEKGLGGTPDYPTPHSRQTSRMAAFSLLTRIQKAKSKTYCTEGKKHNTDVARGLDKTLRVLEGGQEVSLPFSLGRWGNMICGAAVEYGRARGDAMAKQEESVFSLFGSDSVKPGGLPVTLTAGLRVNFYSAFDNTVNPEIKAVIHRNGWNATLAYNRANNTPSFHQRYNETSSTRPNPGLKMETTDNYSISLLKTLSPTLSLGVAVFYNELSDRITYVRNENGIGKYENFGEVTYKGGDVSLNWKATDDLTLKASYTYLDARDEQTGFRLPAKARHKANMQLLFTPLDSLSFAVATRLSSKVYTRSDNSRSVPGYALVDLRGEYRFREFALFGEIKNLTDKTYYYSDGILAPPFTWLAGLNWHF